MSTGVEFGLLAEGVEVGGSVGVVVLGLELSPPFPKILFWAPFSKPHSLNGHVRKCLPSPGVNNLLEIVGGVVLVVEHLQKVSVFHQVGGHEARTLLPSAWYQYNGC